MKTSGFDLYSDRRAFLNDRGCIMEKLRNFGDIRQRAWCVHCGGGTETRDHVPSRIFLDEPYPTDLPVVRSCGTCNVSFSLDEEYVACVIECILTGDVNVDEMKREKVRRILRAKPELAGRIRQGRVVSDDGAIHFKIETSRMRNLALKLARGHVVYELNEPQFGEPSYIDFWPLALMNNIDHADFEAPPALALWPEVGSRAMQRMIVSGNTVMNDWVVVQDGRYRYRTVVDGGGLSVRMVIGEYLACMVNWD